MSDVMMQLGSYQFSIPTAAYQELQRSTEWNWAEQKRFGQEDALQFTGYGERTITMSGVVFPEFNGDIGQLDDMRDLGDSGRPLTLVSGLGDIMGRWVIKSLQETHSIFAQAGVSRKQEFTIQLRNYSK